MKISAAIITLNEERNIARCIDSLRDIADEILVMDSGSIDRTEEICKEKDVKFFFQPWLGYAQQKNHLNKQASYDMILSIDADEEISPALSMEILALKKECTHGVFALNRLTNYCGTWIYHSGWYPDFKVRLFPKEYVWEGDVVHESLRVPKGITPVFLKGHLNHYSYYSLEQHRKRADYYSSLTAIKYANEGKTVFIGKPVLSAVFRFFAMYLFKFGFLDGIAGFHIARISAASNFYKYKEVQRLKSEPK